MKSLKGHLLIASPKLLDPNFARAVVLVIQHNEEGALGLVLNRPLEMTVRDAWEQVSEGPCDADGHLYRGGPCDGPLMVVHTDAGAAEVEILDGLYFTTERDQIEKLVSDEADPARFFVGYAGWGKDQLEAEMQEGSWLVAPADPAHVFADDDVWQELTRSLVRSAELPGVNPKCIPEDPSTN